MIKQNMKHFNRLFVAIDSLLIILALFFSWFIRFRSGWILVAETYLPLTEYMRPVLFIVPVYLLIYNSFHLYTPHRTKSNLDELMNLVKANLIGIFLFFGYLYISKNIHYSRVLLLLFFSSATIFCFFERVILRHALRKMRKKGLNKKHIVLVGMGNLAKEYARRVHENIHWGYDIVGIFDNNLKRETVALYDGLKVRNLGPLSGLEAYLKGTGIDEVIITLPLSAYTHLDEVIETCEKTGVFTRIIPDYHKYIPTRPEIEDIDGLPIISIRQVPLNDVVYKSLKRLVDIFGALFGLVILSPLFLFLAVSVKTSSEGPVIFKQTRVGLNKNNFKMYKFRSMGVQKKDDEKKAWTKKNDPRVTKIGKVMRKTSMDELPQLINVLRGDMSLVGPRPERPQFVERFMEEIPKYMVKHQVRPGMTGWAQVHGWRGDTSIETRIEYDLYYIENWSMMLDFKIILMTFFKGLINRNAY